MIHIPEIDAETAARLCRRLAERLRADGDLRSAAWQVCVEGVPRHRFVPSFFHRDGDRWTPVTPERTGTAAWLELAYANESLVTLIDGHLRPEDADGPVTGSPSSSSTLPGLVVRMLEDLDVADGHQVLEIGTGTGYSTALLCRRLGDGHVTSVEIDPGVAGRAATALRGLGHHPALVVGDGLAGVPANAPYDRLIATCSVRTVPRPWLEQTRPGGVVLATLQGRLAASGLARLTVHGPARAEGRFLPGTVSFMIARTDAPPELGDVSEVVAQPGQERETAVGADVCHDWTGNFVAQLGAPEIQWIGYSVDKGPYRDYFIDPKTSSYALLLPGDDGTWRVRQGGPRRVWDGVEAAVETWRAAGSPGQTAFGLSVAPHGQYVWLTDPQGPRWELTL
ncbi:ATP-grasp peptide maturase system methyltransferase [Streptomyces sp. B1866]|uniref:ATP-grasp peptide maturase system methyltransferase n=1 Tax=Streptomyces sp. B1866 TaxID=3075431 RepID=UPI0028924DD2|nr:ATP-grasp peptide maturase system methyltransferase [Streptomyces sp. B1866]MDT3395309.1 ATP-grasp peptide maturase system methyltransferase [Streptomyces sp. B1866]